MTAPANPPAKRAAGNPEALPVNYSAEFDMYGRF